MGSFTDESIQLAEGGQNSRTYSVDTKTAAGALGGKKFDKILLMDVLEHLAGLFANTWLPSLASCHTLVAQQM